MTNTNNTPVNERGEWGVFVDGECLEYGFCSRKDAEEAIIKDYEADAELSVAMMCHDHPDQPEMGCEHPDCES